MKIPNNYSAYYSHVGCTNCENSLSSGVFGFTRQQGDGRLMTVSGPEADGLISGAKSINLPYH